LIEHYHCDELCAWISLAQLVAFICGAALLGLAAQGWLMKLGRNQLIAVCTYGTILAASIALVLMGKATGAEWLSFAGTFGPMAVGSILVPSSILKTAGVVKNGKKPAG